MTLYSVIQSCLNVGFMSLVWVLMYSWISALVELYEACVRTLSVYIKSLKLCIDCVWKKKHHSVTNLHVIHIRIPKRKLYTLLLDFHCKCIPVHIFHCCYKLWWMWKLVFHSQQQATDVIHRAWGVENLHRIY